MILAAGESLRMGKPKQLLEFRGHSFLKNAARAAGDSKTDLIAVVLGAEEDLLQKELYGRDLEIVHNKDWKSGMGSSICSGLTHLLEIDPALDALVITVCDQPFLTAEIIDGLIDEHLRSKTLIVASAYGNTIGVPALFGKQLFSEISRLKGKRGAKQIIEKYRSQTVSLPFPKGNIDIDTPEDYAQLPGAGFFG